MPASVTAYEAALRERVAELEETVVQMREAFAPTPVFPAAWRLTRSQRIILSALHHHAGATGLVRTEALCLRVGRPGDPIDPRVVVVQICRMRRALAPFGIAIRTFWGEGYALTPASHVAIAAAIAHESPEVTL